jgi:hypothetical protein
MNTYLSWGRILLRLSFLYLSCNSILLANNLNYLQHIPDSEYPQWFTGALLIPYARTVPPAHPALEVVFVASENYGRYNSEWELEQTPRMWGMTPYYDFQASFTNTIGFELIGSVITNFSSGQVSTHLQDTILRLGFQVSNDKGDSWVPDFKIIIQEVFPTGNYQKLSSHKNSTDSTGEGSFQTGVHAAFEKSFNQLGKHPFRIRGDIGYSIPAAVNVQGLNYYGGTSQTKCTVYPGKYYTIFLFGELSLTKRCALALELNYQHGEPGRISGLQTTKMNVASFDELCVLPEFQYTLTKNMGLILGGWFTVAGKNTTAFRGGVAALLILF